MSEDLKSLDDIISEQKVVKRRPEIYSEAVPRQVQQNRNTNHQRSNKNFGDRRQRYEKKPAPIEESPIRSRSRTPLSDGQRHRRGSHQQSQQQQQLQQQQQHFQKIQGPVVQHSRQDNTSKNGKSANISTSYANNSQRSAVEKTSSAPQPKRLQLNKNTKDIQIKYLDTGISTKDILEIATEGKSTVEILKISTETEYVNNQLMEKDALYIKENFDGSELDGSRLSINLV